MPKPVTYSDPISADGRYFIECPWCSEFISEELDNVEPGRGTEITCPNCSKEVDVTLKLLNQYIAMPAQADGKLTLVNAIATKCCRICGKTANAPLTLNYGREFAHTACLEKSK